MKSNSTYCFTSKLVDKLKKEAITLDDFFKLLSHNQERFFDSPQLEFELLLSNGFPIDIYNDKVFLKTAKNSIEEQTFCVVDIETNGGHVNKGHQIIEIGAVKYKDGVILDSYESLVYAKDIPEYIQEVTNITPRMLEDAPTIKTVLEEFKLFLEDDVLTTLLKYSLYLKHRCRLDGDFPHEYAKTL